MAGAGAWMIPRYSTPTPWHLRRTFRAEPRAAATRYHGLWARRLQRAVSRPSNEPSPNKTPASAMQLRVTRQAARRRPTAGTRKMRPGTTVETSDDVHAAQVVE